MPWQVPLPSSLPSKRMLTMGGTGYPSMPSPWAPGYFGVWVQHLHCTPSKGMGSGESWQLLSEPSPGRGSEEEEAGKAT